MNDKIAASELKSFKEFSPIIRKEIMRTYRNNARFDRDWLNIVLWFFGLVVAPFIVMLSLVMSGKFSTKVLVIALISAIILTGLWVTALILMLNYHKMINNEDINYVVYTSTNKGLTKSKYLDKNGDYTKRKCAMFGANKIELLYPVDYDRLEPEMKCIILCEKNKPRYAIIEDLAGIRLSQPRRKLTPKEKRIRHSEQIKRSMNPYVGRKIRYVHSEDEDGKTQAFKSVH